MNSDIVSQSIRCLYQEGFWFLDMNPKLKALDSISTYGQVRDISDLYRFIFSTRKRIALKTSRVISDLLSKIKPREWIELYNVVKYQTINNEQIRWITFRFSENEAINLLGLATLNSCGYSRQYALKMLAKYQNGKVLPFLFLRLSDWVEPVRKEALAMLNQYMKPEYTPYFWEYHYLFDWMLRVKRVDLQPLVGDIFIFLLNNLSEIDLSEQLQNADRPKRLFFYKLLATDQNCHARLFELIQKEPESTIRFWYLKNILAKNSLNCAGQVKVFLHDSSSRIKTYLLSDNLFRDLLPIDYVKEKLYDNSSLVREIARYRLKNQGYTDFVSVCREVVLSQKGARPGHLLGLAETGDMNDYHTIEQYVTHSNSRIRRAAILGLSYLNHEYSISYLMMGLNDKAGKVREACSTALKKNMDENTIESLRSNINEMTIDGKITALALLCDRKSWESLIDILSLSRDENEVISNKAWDELKFWIQKRNSRLWVKPEPNLLLKIEKEIQNVHNIPKDKLWIWNELESLIKTGKKFWI